MDALYRCVRFVVDGEAARERLAELDRTECGGECEEFGDVGEVAQGLGVTGERGRPLEREYRCSRMGGEGGGTGVKWLPSSRKPGSLCATGMLSSIRGEYRDYARIPSSPSMIEDVPVLQHSPWRQGKFLADSLLLVDYQY